MRMVVRPWLTLLAMLVLLTPCLASAERFQEFGDYVIHFNALSTDLIPPEVARTYDIRRSPGQALINVAILKKVMGTQNQPTAATVSGEARNLTGMVSDLSFREIREGTAIYYIDTIRVNNEETLAFTVDVQPEGSDELLRVRFDQQFFTQ